MHFASPLFETHPAMIQLKSMLLDFFNGHSLEQVHLAGLEHVISVTAGPLPTPPESAASASSSSSTPLSESATLPTIHFRTSTIRLLSSGTRIPRMELTPMGPNFDFKIRRRQEAEPDVEKEALRRPKLAKKDVEKGLGRKRKNIETDDMGDRVGRIHIGKQDINNLQSVAPPSYALLSWADLLWCCLQDEEDEGPRHAQVQGRQGRRGCGCCFGRRGRVQRKRARRRGRPLQEASAVVRLAPAHRSSSLFASPQEHDMFRDDVFKLAIH